METPIENLASAVHSALIKDLADIEFMHQTGIDRSHGRPGTPRKRRPNMSDIHINMFPQTWGSTSTGFGGIGGSAMTTVYTIVVMTFTEAAVYFNGRFAYLANPNNVLFQTDLAGQNMRPVSGSARYMITNSENKKEE